MSSIYKNISGSQTIITYASHLSGSSYSAVVDVMKKNTWYSIYSVDFTALPTGSVYGDGPISINGVVWDRNSSANAEYMSYSSNGLSMKCNANASEWFDWERTAPLFVLPLKNLFVDSLSLFSDLSCYDIRIVAQVSGSNFSHNYEAVDVGVEISTSLPTTQNYVGVTRYFDAGCANQMRLAWVRNIANTGVFTANDYTNPNESLAIFTIEDLYGVTLATGFTSTPSSPINLNMPLQNSRLGPKINWGTYRFNTATVPPIQTAKELNFVFAINTSFAFRDFIGHLCRLYIQVKPK